MFDYKKGLAALFAASLILLCGCGKKQAEPDATADQSAATVATADSAKKASSSSASAAADNN